MSSAAAAAPKFPLFSHIHQADLLHPPPPSLTSYPTTTARRGHQMPSRQLRQTITAAAAAHHHHRRAALLIAVACAVILLLVACAAAALFYLYRRRRSTIAAAAAPPRRFRHRELRDATDGFSPSRRLGRGASASVLRGVLSDGSLVAVKLFDPPPESSSFIVNHEFQNELHTLLAIPPSPFVISLVGYSLETHRRRRRRRRFLVFEYMPNGSLQDALFGSGKNSDEPPATLGWSRRYGIILDVAQALCFLHLDCDPPVVHGDIKPSNVLLNSQFRAKVSDFGLARFKHEAAAAAPAAEELFFSQDLGPAGEELHEPPPMTMMMNSTSSFAFPPQPPSPSSPSNAAADEERGGSRRKGRDWWWKQEPAGELRSRYYVQEWIGSQICHRSGDPDWEDDDMATSSPAAAKSEPTIFVGEDGCFIEENQNPKKKNIDDNVAGERKEKKKVREWWKEEYFAEMNQQKRNKGPKVWLRNSSHEAERSRGAAAGAESDDMDDDMSFCRKGWKKRKKKMMKKRSRSAGGSDVFSGDLLCSRGEVSSTTTSMRGTVCYVAPELGFSGRPAAAAAEKADIYSFGVLILVIVSGRRPLHVMSSSPVRMERANLVSWCRQLAANGGDVLDLVDERLKEEVEGLWKEQARLCINLALLCLQRVPEMRPDTGDVVKILRGEMELPVAPPLESSPSPRSRLYSRSRRRRRDPTPPPAERD